MAIQFTDKELKVIYDEMGAIYEFHAEGEREDYPIIKRIMDKVASEQGSRELTRRDKTASRKSKWDRFRE